VKKGLNNIKRPREKNLSCSV